MVRGACLCGTLRYEVDGPFDAMMHCHCSMCRKHHGTAFATFVGAPLKGFRWVSDRQALATYPSSEHGRRNFCRVCGSVMPLLSEEMGMAFLPAGNLEGDLGVRPQSHIFAGSKASWYEITDDLPQHQEYPPEFGASGLKRPDVELRAGVHQGSCLCGDVAYEIESEPVRMMYCHCSRCRRGRSAAHATNVFWRADGFRWVRGEEQVVEYRVPGAQRFGVAFCRRCGSELPRVSREGGIAVVPAGSLDSDPGIRPLGHIFVGSKASWFEITDSIPQFVEMPPQ